MVAHDFVLWEQELAQRSTLRARAAEMQREMLLRPLAPEPEPEEGD